MYSKCENDLNKSDYKKYKNKLVSVIRVAEKNYNCSRLEEAKVNMKKTWTI